LTERQEIIVDARFLASVPAQQQLFGQKPLYSPQHCN
jgi:hypothetical protein